MVVKVTLRRLGHVLTIDLRSINRQFIRNSRVTTRRINKDGPNFKPVVFSGQLSSAKDVEAIETALARCLVIQAK